ncbi:hypothetical protein M0R04_05380 [Candidatus Dojkabacteria bacterium]|jgi:hypothetical protein|nr:hypothetical protein [Candidatus Dojkabacteria bacterium]
MYYILANQLDGELIQISTEPLVAGQGQMLKVREGNIPDLTKFEWHSGGLVFVEKDKTRTLTRLAFMRRFTNEELALIYGAAKSNIQLEVWLDKFKLAEEISLDDIEIVDGLGALEQFGILNVGRGIDILS